MSTTTRATNQTSTLQRAGNFTVFSHSYKLGKEQQKTHTRKQVNNILSKRQAARVPQNDKETTKHVEQPVPPVKARVVPASATAPKQRSEKLARQLMALIANGASAKKASAKASEVTNAKYREARVADFRKVTRTRGARSRAMVAAC
jgi:hypothetical protein